MRNKSSAVCDIVNDRKIDILALTETWHENSTDACLSSIVSPGGSFAEQARPLSDKAASSENVVNHGGVVCVARRGITLTKLDLKRKSVF